METESELTMGATPVDWWGAHGHQTTAKVIDGIDADGFFALLLEMLRLWQAVRGDRAMSGRRDFAPEMPRGHLGWIVLVDVEPAPLRFRYRLIGSEFTR